ncbi:hypothetical protein QG053_11700, partial [Kingella kingae]|uniref:hypothetical protein n=1 Tax=Kingella kingae TaxID=504 RepID=UPI00254E4A39
FKTIFHHTIIKKSKIQQSNKFMPSKSSCRLKAKKALKAPFNAIANRPISNKSQKYRKEKAATWASHSGSLKKQKSEQDVSIARVK